MTRDELAYDMAKKSGDEGITTWQFQVRTGLMDAGKAFEGARKLCKPNFETIETKMEMEKSISGRLKKQARYFYKRIRN